jgi:hypothetical protein
VDEERKEKRKIENRKIPLNNKTAPPKWDFSKRGN